MSHPKGAAAIVIDDAFRKALAQALGELAREIQSRDKCSDDEAIAGAMKEYDRIVLRLHSKRSDLHEAQERKRAEDALRRDGKPTLKVSLGEVSGLAALRDKIAKR